MLTYQQLWELFLLTEQPPEQASKAEIPGQLERWQAWASRLQTLGFLPQCYVEMAYGPIGFARVYDRATIGAARFTSTRLEESKKAMDSVVLMQYEGRLRAARVQAFLSHAAPGSSSDELDAESNVAYVHWYQDVADDESATAAGLSCPIFRHAEGCP